jgi:flavodoxin
MKILVVYTTRTGATKFVAETIAAELGADIEEIVDQKKRAGPIGWLSAGKDSMSEKQTEIAPTTRNPADYDLIALGTPVWAWRPTPALRTYVANHDFLGKRVALFFTMDSDLKQAIEKTKAMLLGAIFMGELALAKPLKEKAETEKKIADWCSTLKTV